MPTYEYQCQKCRRRHEASQSITAKPLTKCQTCGGRLKRLISSGSGFLFKGSGFYITDHRSKSYHEAKKKDQPSSSASPSSGASGTGPAPAATKSGPGQASSSKPTSSSGEKKS